MDKTRSETVILITDLTKQISIACEHTKYETSIATYIDPRIIYHWLVKNDLMQFAHKFFVGKELKKFDWAHPRHYNYNNFNGYY